MNPAPVGTDKLKLILGNAKKIMQKVEATNPIVQSNTRIDEDYERATPMSKQRQQTQPYYDPRDEREPQYSTPDLSQYQTSAPRMYTAEDVMASNLPPAIKEAMIKRPIPKVQAPLTHSFSLSDVQDLIDPRTQRQPLVENRQRPSLVDDMITVSKAELKEMIDERVNQVLVQNFTKIITEQAIKKTINMLIKEGKLTIKKK